MNISNTSNVIFPVNKANPYSSADSSIPEHVYKILYGLFYHGLMPATILVGLFGNVLTLIILIRLKFRSSTSISLLFLTIADIFFLLYSLVWVSIRTLREYNQAYSAYVQSSAQSYFATIRFLSSRYTGIITIFIAAERFVAILFPFRVKRIFTKRINAILLSMIFFILLALHIPYIFTTKLQVIYLNSTGTTRYASKLTPFGQNKKFWIPYENTLLITTQVMPPILLGLFNIMMVIVLYRMKEKRDVMSIKNTSQSNNTNKELLVFKITFAITAVYTICLLPSALLNLIVITNPSSDHYQPQNNAGRVSRFVTLELQIINSAVNFVLYLIVNKEYRKVYKSIICCGKCSSSLDNRYVDNGTYSKHSKSNTIQMSVPTTSTSNTLCSDTIQD